MPEDKATFTLRTQQLAPVQQYVHLSGRRGRIRHPRRANTAFGTRRRTGMSWQLDMPVRPARSTRADPQAESLRRPCERKNPVVRRHADVWVVRNQDVAIQIQVIA